ncbi:MAG: hypothetical protein IJL66_02870 [Lachnospiraceae bacterium]|nr:hypothetical protein [Lachnospiraceae bacterium]
MKTKTGILKAIMYLIVVVVLLDSSTMYRYLTNTPLYGRGFGWLMGILCLLFLVTAGSLSIRQGQLIRLVVIVAAFLVYALVTRYNTNRFLTSFVGVFVCLFLFSCVLYRKGLMQEFLTVYSRVMLILAVVSLFFWLFGSVLDILPGRRELVYYWADHYRTTYTYFYMYFENPVQNNVHSTLCNVGIFAEAPGYSGFLTYALLIEMVTRKFADTKDKQRKAIISIVIFVVTLLSTSSTKGIIVVMIAIAINYVSKGSRNRSAAVVKIVAASVAIAGIAFVSSALIGEKMLTTSGMVRMDDFIAGLKAFLQHPLFGAGYNNSQAIIDFQNVSRSNRGLSMGLTVLMSYGGLWLLSIYVGAAAVSYKSQYFRTNRSVWFLVIAVLVFNLLISNSAFSIPYIFLLAAAYAGQGDSAHVRWAKVV